MFPCEKLLFYSALSFQMQNIRVFVVSEDAMQGWLDTLRTSASQKHLFYDTFEAFGGRSAPDKYPDINVYIYIYIILCF